MEGNWDAAQGGWSERKLGRSSYRRRSAVLFSMDIMPRMARVAPAAFVYHVLNRSVGRMHIFRQEADFEAFEQIMVEAHSRQPIRIRRLALTTA
jgi:hypothetical protein